MCVSLQGAEAYPPQPADTVAVSPGPLLIENTGRVSTVTILYRHIVYHFPLFLVTEHSLWVHNMSNGI